ncbi:acyl-CoA thioesterase [Nocardioides sp. SYSU DS0663]|uniref:acyl-CoA thioesterase n=1 Tax=Nocardioides sp. SYSU DS0663 TaxID=3416445 RepID=UPI003F4BCA11
MRHVYECPLRWGDMDLLGHVNNVVYVDYLQEARVDMLRTHGRSTATGDLAEGVVVVRTEITYRAPLEFRFRPVQVECWVTEIRAASFTIAYELFQEDAEGRRTVYARATTLLTPYVFEHERPRRLTAEEKRTLEDYLEPAEPVSAPVVAPRRERVGRYEVQVRFSDVDVFRHVNNVKYFEYFQEARILYFARLWRDAPLEIPRPTLVVAHKQVEYKVPLVHRTEPYEAWSWISRVGTTSFDVQSDLCDGETVLARATTTIVVFDPETQRATRPLPVFREALLSAAAGPPVP